MKTPKNKKHLNLMLIALIALMSVFGCDKTGRNTSDNTKSKVETPSPTPVEIQSKSLSIVADNTGSSSNVELPQTVDTIKESLAAAEYISSVDVFNIGGNGKQTWEATRQHFDFPVKPVNKFNETDERAKAKKNGCGSRKQCIEREVNIAKKREEADYLREIAAYNEKRNNIIQEIGDALLQSPGASPFCSDIQEMGEFVAQTSSGLAIWLTDGQHNCKTSFTGVEFKSKSVLIGILPIKDEVAGGFKKRFDNLSGKFSNVPVKPITSFNKQMILEFLAR